MDTPNQMLVFSVGEHQYAMDILHLREVGRMPQIEAEPAAPAGVLGIARLHGEPVRVRALAACLGEGPSHGEPAAGVHRPWLIVSRGRQGDEHWLVDAVQDIVEYDPAQVHTTAEADSGCRIAGLIEIDGHLTYLLTPELLTGRSAE